MSLSVYFENTYEDDLTSAAYLYDRPVRLITARTLEDIMPALKQIDQAVLNGQHVAGWISYEAGLALEQRLAVRLSDENSVPYIHMGVFNERQKHSSREADALWQANNLTNRYTIGDLRLNIDQDEYDDALDKIKQYLIAGDIYQVNYTLKAKFNFQGNLRDFYARLRQSQPAGYSAWISTDEWDVLSLSPELFLEKSGRFLKTKPMKGTHIRGLNNDQDQQFSDHLRGDVKNQAENLMIVDLLRNDLSRIAKKKSVKVLSLYDIEYYRTVLQMTSSIQAKLPKKIQPSEMIKGMFPCGSVTGAPKIRAMEIIDDLEKENRGVYCGSIGYFSPDGGACLNVAIRTMTIDKNGHGEMGIGSGIVADSISKDEYQECLLKAEFLTHDFQPFDLIETFKWDPEEGYAFRDEHLGRLKSSAEYFGFQFEEETLNRVLDEHIADVAETSPLRVRLLLSKRGEVSLTSMKLIDTKSDQIVVLASEKVNSSDRSLYHKTTNRQFYDDKLHQYKAANNCFDVIFLNEREELTEGSYTNLFIEKDGQLYTPQLSCGVLPGIYRQHLLDNGKAQEKILSRDDLLKADKIFLANSVRGLVEVRLSSP